MKILLVGPRWYGQTTVFVRQAIEALGHRPLVQTYRPWMDTDPRSEAHRARRLNLRLRRGVVDLAPDFVLFLKGEFVSRQTVDWIERRGVPTVAWWFDDPRPWKTFMDVLPRLNRFFIFDPAYLPLLKSVRRGRMHDLPLGFSPEAYSPPRRRIPSRWQLSFLGTPFPTRIRMLESLTPYKPLIVGPGWKKVAPRLAPFLSPVPKLAPRAACRLYHQSAIVLNLHHGQSLTAPNQRTFEIAGGGAFQLVDFKPAMGEFFNPGSEIETFRSVSELGRKVRYYLAHPTEARGISEAAFARAHREHTYAHRIKAMLSVLSRG